MLKRFVFLCVLPLILSTGAFGQSNHKSTPGFSCNDNLVPTEAVICSNDGLASLDRQLAALYGNSLRSLAADQQAKLQAAERTWIAERNRCGTIKSCIGNAYQARISSLGGHASQIASPIVAQNRPTDYPTSYVVDGLTLGGQVVFGSDAYKQYQCSESEQFPAFIWCQKQRREPSRWGEVTLSNSILHARDGQAVYISRYIEPAYFNPTDIRTQMESLSAKFAERPREFRIPPQHGLPKAVIAVWGRIQLDPISAADVSLIASGGSPHKGFLVSFLGDLERSAKRGVPIYRLTGGPGFLWAATFNEQGRGVLRFLTIDPSRLPAPVQIATTKAGPTSVTPRPLPEQSAVPNAPIKERVSQQSLAKPQPTNSESPTIADSPAHCQNLAPEYITLDTRNQRVVLDGKSCDVLNDDRDATELSLYCAGERRQVKLQTKGDSFFVGNPRVVVSLDQSKPRFFYICSMVMEAISAGISPSWIENHKFLISQRRWLKAMTRIWM